VKRFALEPIEKAPLDELRALQLERLRWSLDHAYRNVARAGWLDLWKTG